MSSILPQPRKKRKMVAVPPTMKPTVVNPIKTAAPMSHDSSDEEEIDTKSYLFCDDEKEISTSNNDLHQIRPQYSPVTPMTTQTSTVVAAPVVNLATANTGGVNSTTNDLRLSEDVVSCHKLLCS